MDFGRKSFVLGAAMGVLLGLVYWFAFGSFAAGIAAGSAFGLGAGISASRFRKVSESERQRYLVVIVIGAFLIFAPAFLLLAFG